ncbi:MAG: NAD-glutamate dehydrogenase [Pseudomonadota bacterium]
MFPDFEQRRQDLLGQVAQLVAARWPDAERPLVQAFVDCYWGHVASEDLIEHSAANLYGAALSHWSLLRHRPPGEPRIRVYNPDPEQHSWHSPHSAIQIVTDDMPFLMDSLAMACNRLGLTVHLIVHPTLCVTRDAGGEVTALTDCGQPTDACLHFEVDRQPDADGLARIHEELLAVLGEVRQVVGDWPAMRKRIGAVLAELDAAPVAETEREEAGAFLRWLLDDHFTLLGCRTYDLVEAAAGGATELHAVPGSGLGILRQDGAQPVSHSFSALPDAVRRQAQRPEPLILSKSNQRSRVHRPGYLDYVGVRRFAADGRVVGEHRILGLYGSSVHYRDPRSVPVLRRKIQAVLERARLPVAGHDYRALVNILDGYPREELFQIDVDTLHRIALGILRLRDRQTVRLFVRPDPFQRFVSCLVYVPRENYDTRVRQRMEQVLRETYGSEQSEFAVSLSEATLARVHFTVRLPERRIPAVDERALELRLARAVRSWEDELRDALREHCGEARGNQLHARYRDAFSAAYREDTQVGAAVHDIERLECLGAGQTLALVLYRPLEAAADQLRLRLYHRGPITLSALLPMLENLGVEVLEERSYQLRVVAGDGWRWIHDFGLRYPPADRDLDLEPVRELFEDAFSAVWHGAAENDAFNQLVLAGRLGWREIAVLRAYSRYLRQAGSLFSLEYMAQTLVRNARIARLLLRLFHNRFDPERVEARRAARIAEQLELALNEVPSLDEDRMLRRILAAVQATVRTNFYRRDAAGAPLPYLSFKLLPGQIPEMPRPVPAAEIYVYSPRTEGVHLRAGKVARGGLRWSERREDYRTEVLGLLKAQMIKNAVIVPAGAKGGFVVRNPPPDWAALRAEAQACYRTFVRGLLDLTDNYRGGAVVGPPQVVRHDGDDPYLVVAADKGTATFSDLANEVAAEYDFWLRDAFASGGSHGYDHKRMGITARGAWVAVRRHFRELDRDPDREPLTAVGIGDLSGDVFGNGVLQSRQLRLLAAFDHRHLFLDPDPDPEVSYRERARLFALPHSSWDDYDRACLSPGGGIHPRTAKAIPLTPQVRSALAIDTDAAELTPAALIQAILRAPVDLLWNGGIGVFVKSARESHLEVGDRGNDGVRIDAGELRCRVIGEGGNLGITQRARVEYALAGGRINTDAIDNAGGVDCSDHEVNIKILLDAAVEEGELTVRQRNQLLAESTDEVADLVLRDCYRQTGALSLMEAQAPRLLGEHARQIRALEAGGRITRALDGLPGDAEIEARAAAGLGLTRPELAVLLAHAKLALNASLQAADFADRPGFEVVLARYFPARLAARFAAGLGRHRLRRAIICNEMANEVLDRLGAGFAFRLEDAEGVAPADAVQAYVAIRDIHGLDTLWAALDALDGRVAARLQMEMQLEVLALAEVGVAWLVRTLGDGAAIGAAAVHLAARVGQLEALLEGALPAAERQRLAERAAALSEQGVPAELAARIARLEPLAAALDIAAIADQTGAPLERAVALYFELADALAMARLQAALEDYLPRDLAEERCRAGLRADCARQLRDLAALAAAADRSDQAAAVWIAEWLGGQGGVLARFVRTLAELPAAGAGLAQLAVAVQDLRQLVESSRRAGEGQRPAPGRSGARGGVTSSG